MRWESSGPLARRKKTCIADASLSVQIRAMQRRRKNYRKLMECAYGRRRNDPSWCTRIRDSRGEDDGRLVNSTELACMNNSCRQPQQQECIETVEAKHQYQLFAVAIRKPLVAHTIRIPGSIPCSTGPGVFHLFLATG